MCGIVGILAKTKMGFYQTQVSVFKEMLYADQLRGKDGTGIFYNNGSKICTLKAPSSSSRFLHDPLVVKAMESLSGDSLFAVGHNRSATIGEHNHENTHPHRGKHITLIHNGTLRSHKELADVESDSLAICKSIADIGAEKTLEKLNGAFALVWYNANNKTINICRNTERPLFLLETGNCYVFASEPKMAEWIIERNKLNFTSCISFLPGILYTYSFVSFKFEESKVNLRQSNFHYFNKKQDYMYSDFDDFYIKEATPIKNLPSHREKVFKIKNKFIEKLGGLVYFRPQEIIQCDIKTEYYIKGYNDVTTEVRVYSNDMGFLQILMCSNNLVGELKSIAWIENKRVFFLKDVRQSYVKSKTEIN